MLPAHRMPRQQFAVLSILGLLLLVIILDTLHVIHWPVNARYVIAYPRLFLNRPLYIYDAIPPGINAGMDECTLPANLGDSWSGISTGNDGTIMPVRTTTIAPVIAGFVDRLALDGVVRQAPSIYPGLCPPIFYIDATAMSVEQP
jgi:hypothetical protein